MKNSLEDVPTDVAENWIDHQQLNSLMNLRMFFPHIQISYEATKAKEIALEDLVDEGIKTGIAIKRKH